MGRTKKNLDALEVTPIYSAISEATQESSRKPRRRYNKEDAQPYLDEMHTQGRKGLKLKRINMAFAPDTYDYITIMSRVRGESLTEFLNMIIRQHKEEHGEIYAQALKFIDKLDADMRRDASREE